nr:expressed protein [Hymenolepis microstoma]
MHWFDQNDQIFVGVLEKSLLVNSIGHGRDKVDQLLLPLIAVLQLWVRVWMTPRLRNPPTLAKPEADDAEAIRNSILHESVKSNRPPVTLTWIILQ